jgi:2-amino-4-hydroxy-6-hydroxymethyldihydropteridine diphosphokinase
MLSRQGEQIVRLSVKTALWAVPSVGVRAYVGLGSNLGDREQVIADAVSLLDQHPDIDVLRASALRETEPWGPVVQPLFLNGAVSVETTLTPRALLEALLDVERRLGRVRDERWGPRTIDLDLLLYGDAVVDEPGLTVPHPRLRERAFALEPLHELDPCLVIPGEGPVSQLLDALDGEGDH